MAFLMVKENVGGCLSQTTQRGTRQLNSAPDLTFGFVGQRGMNFLKRGV